LVDDYKISVFNEYAHLMIKVKLRINKRPLLFFGRLKNELAKFKFHYGLFAILHSGPDIINKDERLNSGLIMTYFQYQFTISELILS
jgi:hypothetical protein